MNVKKEVAERMSKVLRNELTKVCAEIRSNTYQINNLSDKNAVLKRQRSELSKTINEWESVSIIEKTKKV